VINKKVSKMQHEAQEDSKTDNGEAEEEEEDEE
jgi:hypothetical protein